MADVPVPSIATATPDGDDTVLGVKDGNVRRFSVRQLAEKVADILGGGFNNDWWKQSSTPALFAADVSLGAGKGYTAGTTGVGSVIDLSGNGGPLLPGSGEAPLTTINGFPAMTFDGGTTVRAYSGPNNAITALFAASPWVSFSLHHTVKLSSVGSTQYPMALNAAPGSNSPALLSLHSSIGTHDLTINSSAGAQAFLSGPVRTYSVNDTAIKTVFVDGPSGLSTTILNGYINDLEDGPRITSPHPYPLNLDNVNIGNYVNNAGSGGLIGAFAGAAVFGGTSHTLADASRVHKAMLRRWSPADLKTAFTVFGYGQSNMEAAYTNADPVTFTNGDAVGWLASNPDFYARTGIGHAYFGTNASPAVWFAKELHRILGGLAVLTFHGSGGTALAGGGINGSASYLEPQTAAGQAAGGTSTYTSRLSLNQRFAKLCNFTPAFDSERFRVMLFVGCESDVANLIPLKVGGVVPPDTLAAQTANVRRALNNMLDAFRSNLGFTHFALVLTPRRGSTLAEVQGNAPLVDAVNAAYYQVVAERSDTYIVYEHSTGYSTSSFAMNDLVVDSDGAWVSGVGIVDGVHYTVPQYKAIGITSARNFVAAIGATP